MVHIKHTTAPLYIKNLPKNYQKLGNNYGTGFRLGLGLGIGLVFRVSDTQRHYGAVVCFIWTQDLGLTLEFVLASVIMHYVNGEL